MALKEKWRYPEWQKERVPDGDTLCWLRCRAKDECNAIVPARVN